MARLPQPGADQGQWGEILNDFLSQAHASSGAIKDGSITESQLDPAVQTKLNNGGGGAITSVNGQTGTVTITKSDVNLSNVDNTSDVNKPVSTATQTALNLKANTSTLSTVATSGSYADLSNKPTIPATKADIGLANVDNTSDATKNSATATLTNKTLTSPIIAKINNLNSNGLVTTSDGDGTLGVSTLPLDGNKYLDGFGNFTAPQAILVEKGAFTPSTTYTRGDVVTYQYARWYRINTGSGGATFTPTDWIHLGLYAVGTTSDPGNGMLWIDVS